MSMEARMQRLARQLWQLLAPTRIDVPLLLALGLLSTLSLAVVWSASGQDGDMLLRQTMRFGLGFALLAIAMRIPPVAWRRWTPWFYGACLLLLVAVAWLGEGKGAQRWLDLGIVRFQPSELMKLGLPMMLAWHFHDRVLPPSLPAFLVGLAWIAAPAALIATQPDLGTSILVSASGPFVIFLAGLRW
jgi:rod shape determining protein RodA